MKSIKYIIALIAVVFCIRANAQDRYNYFQMAAYGGYEWFSDTFSHSGYAVDINMDYHFHKTFYASLLCHIGGYEGAYSREIMVGTSPMQERFSDSKGVWMVGIGPGADLVSDRHDRIYVCLYAGYAGVHKTSSTYDEETHIVDNPTSDTKGFGAVLRLGYEHCFDSGFLLGGAVNGLYVGRNINWSAGITAGFRF